MYKAVEHLAEESRKIHREVQGRTIGYILTALGLVAGLAWNEAITAIIQHFLPLGKDGIWAKLVYAVIITILVVIVGVYVNRLLVGEEEEKKQ